MKHITSIIEGESTWFAEFLCNRTAVQNSIDIVKTSQFIAVNVIFQACFGRTFVSADDPLFESLLVIMHNTIKHGGQRKITGIVLPCVKWKLNFSYKSEKETLHYMRTVRTPVYERLIKTALQGDAPCLAKSMHKNKKDSGYDDKDILVTLSKQINNVLVYFFFTLNISSRFDNRLNLFILLCPVYFIR